MTYLTFLLVFIVPPILALAALQPNPADGWPAQRGKWALLAILAIAFSYTTPWDNYLVYAGVWWYGDERVIGTIGYVPIEEYMFFLLQPILTGLLLYRYLKRDPSILKVTHRFDIGHVIGIAFYFAITVIGAIQISFRGHHLYMGLILAWAGPVLLLLWLYAGPLYLAKWHIFLASFALPTLYLWVADRIAIGLEIWTISDELAYDFDPFGLPIEEALFFLVTNLLVVQGCMLFLYGDVVFERFWSSRKAVLARE
ncbi:MAG: lycopene cyclase domain-containing protein [Bacteroidota bacterium]